MKIDDLPEYNVDDFKTMLNLIGMPEKKKKKKPVVQEQEREDDATDSEDDDDQVTLTPQPDQIEQSTYSQETFGGVKGGTKGLKVTATLNPRFKKRSSRQVEAEAKAISTGWTQPTPEDITNFFGGKKANASAARERSASASSASEKEDECIEDECIEATEKPALAQETEEHQASNTKSSLAASPEEKADAPDFASKKRSFPCDTRIKQVLFADEVSKRSCLEDISE